MRRFPRPGSLLWLLAHDVRLGWRDFRATFRALNDRALGLLLVVLAAVMHAVAALVVTRFAELATDRAAAYRQAAPVVLFLLLLMVAQALNGVTKLMYGRGDLDLVLSSPFSPRKVLFARALAVGMGALASAAIFVVPLADAGAFVGHPRLLAAYPALLGGAFFAAAIGLVTALGLFATVGPRRTRLVAQILATFLGAGFMLGLQLRRFLPAMSLDALVMAGAGAGGVRALLRLPTRAALGEPLPAAAWLLLTGGVFALTCLILGPRFSAATNAAASDDHHRASPRAGAKRGDAGRPETRHIPVAAFGGGVLANLRRKEWRLIARDPWVVSQILLQILYMAPMIVLLWSGTGSVGLALAPMVVVVTFQLGSSLTWLGLSGEDAPELLRTAPVAPRMLRRGKLQAVGVLTLSVVGGPLLWLVAIAPRSAPATVALGLVGLLCAVTLQLWHGRPGKRTAFAARHRESKLVALIEMALSMLLGIATALAVLGSVWVLLPLGAAGAVLLCTRPRASRRREPGRGVDARGAG